MKNNTKQRGCFFLNGETNNYNCTSTPIIGSSHDHFSPANSNNAMDFLKQLAHTVVTAISLVSANTRTRITRITRRRGSNSSSSSNSYSYLERSNSKAGYYVDSYMSDAVEDCIQFIHSSFSTSNSSHLH